MNERHSIVTGGTGYVGRFIVEELLLAGHDVTVLGRRPPAEGFFSRPVRFLPFSLEPEAIPPLPRGDYLVHAAFDHVPGKYRGGEGEDPETFRRRNLQGSISLFESARNAGVRKLVFLSSRAVYGRREPGLWLDELDEPRPDTLYGKVKFAAEQALSALSGPGFTGISLRVTGVYGPQGAGRKHKWSELFDDYLAGKAVSPRAGTEVHGSDVAKAVRFVLELPQPTDPVLNVSDLLVDRRELLGIIQDETGCKHPLPPLAERSSLNVMRTDRLRKLGWIPGGKPLLRKTVLSLLRLPCSRRK